MRFPRSILWLIGLQRGIFYAERNEEALTAKCGRGICCAVQNQETIKGDQVRETSDAVNCIMQAQVLWRVVNSILRINERYTRDSAYKLRPKVIGNADSSINNDVLFRADESSKHARRYRFHIVRSKLQLTGHVRL